MFEKATNTIQFTDVKKHMLRLAPPIAIQNILAAIVSATDAVMLGFLNESSLTAVTLAGQLMQIYTMFLSALCCGTTALAAQYWGQRDKNSVQKVLNITLQISLTIGCILALVCLFIPKVIMMIYSSDPYIIELGCQYLRVVSVSYLFMAFSQVYMIIMKNTGKSAISSAYGGISAVLNVILNAILIFGLLGAPAMGIEGAALATSISRLVELVLTVIASRKKDAIQFHIKDLFHRYKALMRKYYRYTLPGVGQIMSYMVATSVTVAILGHLGNEAVAANAVVLIAFNIFAAIAFGYAAASGIIIGQQLGVGDLETAKKTGDYLMKYVMIFGAAFAVLFIAIGPIVCKFATASLSEEAVYYLKWMFVIMGVKVFGKFFGTMLSQGILIAGGDVKFLMKADIINMWLIIVPIGLIAGFVLKLPVLLVFLLMNIDEYTKFIAEWRHYKKYHWVKNLTKKEWAEPGKYDNQLRATIVEKMPLGVLLLGSSGKISMANKAAGDTLGVPAEDLEGETFATFFLSDERNDDFSQALIDARANNGEVESRVVEYYHGEDKKTIQLRTMFIEEEDMNVGVLAMLNEV